MKTNSLLKKRRVDGKKKRKQRNIPALCSPSSSLVSSPITGDDCFLPLWRRRILSLWRPEATNPPPLSSERLSRISSSPHVAAPSDLPTVNFTISHCSDLLVWLPPSLTIPSGDGFLRRSPSPPATNSEFLCCSRCILFMFCLCGNSST